MEETHVAGLVVSYDEKNHRVVKFLGQECPLIGRQEWRCEEDTSYYGCILDSVETYETPLGIAERRYWARGAGLERSGIEWRLVPKDEIRTAYERFQRACVELEKARQALDLYEC